MKKAIPILLLFLIPTLLFSQEKKGLLKFDTTYIVIDTMGCDDSQTIEYHYTNIGNDSVKIHQVYANCGCTIPAYKKESIAPGESGVIKVQYSSKDFKGDVEKWVIVLSNSTEVQLRFTTFVKECPSEPKLHQHVH